MNRWRSSTGCPIPEAHDHADVFSARQPFEALLTRTRAVNSGDRTLSRANPRIAIAWSQEKLTCASRWCSWRSCLPAASMPSSCERIRSRVSARADTSTSDIPDNGSRGALYRNSVRRSRSTVSQYSTLAAALGGADPPSVCATRSALPPLNQPSSASRPIHALTRAQRKCRASRTYAAAIRSNG